MKEERLKKLARLSRIREIVSEKADVDKAGDTATQEEPELSDLPLNTLPPGPREPEKLQYEVGPVVSPGGPAEDREFLGNIRKTFPPAGKDKKHLL